MSGDSLRLRPYRPDDAMTIVGWLMDERALRMWSADRYGAYPITAEDVNRQYADRLSTDGFFAMTACDEAGVRGHLTMRYTDAEKRTLRFGFVIVDPAFRGRGLGREMLRLALIFAFEVMQAQQVTLGVFEQNAAARRCYRAAGFREVNLDIPEIYRVLGEDWSCVEMVLSRQEWRRGE